MIHLLCCFCNRDHDIRINQEVCLDYQWCLLGTVSGFGCFAPIMRQWYQFSLLWRQSFQPWCTWFATYYCWQHAGDLLSLLSISCVVIGRNSDTWSQRVSALHTTLNFCWTAWYLPSRESVPPFHGSGLAPSTYKVKESSMIFAFSREAPPNGSPCPAEEWMLCLFVSFLADSIQHSSIKVYLSAVRSLHMYRTGFSWSPAQLPTSSKSVERDQVHTRFSGSSLVTSHG